MARIKLLLALSLVSPLALGVAVLGEPAQRAVDGLRPQPGSTNGQSASSLQVAAPTLEWADPPEAQRYRASSAPPATPGEPGWIDPAPVASIAPAEAQIVVELPEVPSPAEIPPVVAPAERVVAASAEQPTAAPAEPQVVVGLPMLPAAPEIPPVAALSEPPEPVPEPKAPALPVIASAEPPEPVPETKAPALPAVAALSEPLAERNDVRLPSIAVPARTAPRVRIPAADPASRPPRPAVRARVEPSAERVRPATPPPAQAVARIAEEPIRLRPRERAPDVLPLPEPKPRLARVPPTRPPRLEARPQTPDLPAILKPDAKLWDSAS